MIFCLYRMYAERVVLGRDQQQLLLVNDFVVQQGVSSGVVEYHNVQLPVQQHFFQRLAGTLLDVDIHIRVFRLEPGYRQRYGVGRAVHLIADGQPPTAVGGQVAQLLLHIPLQQKNLLRIAQVTFPGIGQTIPVSIPLKQTQTQIPFIALQEFGKGRLGNIQGLGCPRDVVVPFDGRNIF